MHTVVWYPLLTLFLLQIKHFIVDFCWQPPYEWKNKGTFGHWGGVRHALKNAIGTGICLFIGLLGFAGIIKPGVVIVLTALDFVIHYFVDLSKMKLNSALKLGPENPKFWALLGLDQMLHQVTYIGIVLLAVWSL